MAFVRVTGLESAISNVDGHAKEFRKAAAKLLTYAAFDGRDGAKNEMKSKFRGKDGAPGVVTAYTLAAFKVNQATEATLTSSVELRVDSGGKARSYDVTLRHLFTGGTRTWKGIEGAFRRLGVLQPGYMIVPGKACPLDDYGNPPRALIVQLISYFNAFGEVGYRANMSDKRRRRLEKVSRSAAGYKTINGVAYFISRGPGMWYGRRQHLQAGIWAKSGTHGVKVQPIFMFVKTGHWRRFIDLQEIGDRVAMKDWSSVFSKELAAPVRSRS